MTILSGCRARARRLLQRLRAGDVAAAAAFLQLQSFAGLDAQALLAQRDRVRLKHALTLVAIELGFASWTAAKTALEAPPVTMHEPRLAGLLNRWFADYDEARASLREHGGYLLPFRSQFFVTESEGIRALGLDPDDSDWQRIGFDWVRPEDRAAHARLVARRRAAIAAAEQEQSR
jgi:hypothetical protein